MVWDEETSCLQIYGQFKEGEDAYIIGSPAAFKDLLLSLDDVLEEDTAIQRTSTSDGECYSVKLSLINETDCHQMEDHYYRQFGRQNQQSYSYPTVTFPQSPYPPKDVFEMIERKSRFLKDY